MLQFSKYPQKWHLFAWCFGQSDSIINSHIHVYHTVCLYSNTHFLFLTPLKIFKLTRRRRLNCANGIENMAYITAMLIGTVTAYLVLVCCPFVVRVVLRYSGSILTESKYLPLNEIISIAEQINCSVNFFIYGLLCSEFRNQFSNICKGVCKIRKSKSRNY